ncbi:2-methylcitrate dehydratase [Terrihabitans soli]|uniref:2-methylcitrate dehydratase n=1 Tax=Terrihabitans soli TaxID=708113 RepID=A0A6S6QLG7_9HYPH|nr:MmgE/PrpD family protein [Terrihabitans soli]BCJ91244.1 2-methylcitrate dehydratase [Terrihabitans soli]
MKKVETTNAETGGKTAALASFAVELKAEQIPQSALRAARHCLTDAIACAFFGSLFPWSRIVVDATERPAGLTPVPGLSVKTDPGTAALLGGTFAHAFELDSLRKPGVGAHPGATVALPALAMGQALGKSGVEVLAAIVAGCEVMFRIGLATLHSAEARGFHAPGITGVFGSAVACGRLMGLNKSQMANAFAISGSMTGGLLRFAASGDGGMIKRLHLGRAGQSGVSAARLAMAGYEGPSDVLEGHFGVLENFAEHSDSSQLIDGLGTRYEIEKLCLKRYACHVTAQAPVQMLRDWMSEHGFDGSHIASIHADVPKKLASNHADREPGGDLALAQYSLPFMLSFASFFDMDDPFVLTVDAIKDARVQDLAGRVELKADPELKGWATRVRVSLKDGRVFAGAPSSFIGCPEMPLDETQLRQRFARLTAAFPQEPMGRLLGQLEGLKDVSNIQSLNLSVQPTTAQTGVAV